MAAATTIYISPRQRQRLFARARRRGTSFSEELRSAVDLYLDLPPGVDRERFEALVRDANASLGRSIARLDESIARVKSVNATLDQSGRRLDELDKKRL